LTDGAELQSDYVLIRRPHFQLQGSTLFWVGSTQPHRQLSAVETDFWNLMQRPVTVKEAREACGDDTDALIREFLLREICELAEPTFPSNRRRVLVIEPHSDDAVLSIGGAMWQRRLECAFVIATMASRSNHTRYRDLGRDYYDINQVTEIRRIESDLCARMIGGYHVAVGMTDVALRYRDSNWTADFYRRHRMSVRLATSRNADDRERQQWTEAVRRLLVEHPSAEVWFPLGGPHTDHMLTTDACFAAFVSNPSLVAGRVLRVYQEIPYAERYPRHMNAALEALRHAGAVLEEAPIPIDTAREQKRRLANIYDSQEIEEMRPDTEASELRSDSAAGPAELLWTLKALPQRLDPAGIVSGAIFSHDQNGTIVAWAFRNREIKRLRVLLLMPTGRWAADLAQLSVAFPHAQFEVYVAPSAEPEVGDLVSDRVYMRKVRSGGLAWFILALQFSIQMKVLPTLFFSGPRRLRQSRFLARLWPRSDTLIVASMDPLVSVLRTAA
jgi:LmbE family N-acetylglucosaminyl deacetylase